MSNGPQSRYPAGSKGEEPGEAEDWVLDNFARAPLAGQSMLDTADFVAAATASARPSSTTWS